MSLRKEDVRSVIKNPYFRLKDPSIPKACTGLVSSVQVVVSRHGEIKVAPRTPMSSGHSAPASWQTVQSCRQASLWTTNRDPSELINTPRDTRKGTKRNTGYEQMLTDCGFGSHAPPTESLVSRLQFIEQNEMIYPVTFLMSCCERSSP